MSVTFQPWFSGSLHVSGDPSEQTRQALQRAAEHLAGLPDGLTVYYTPGKRKSPDQASVSMKSEDHNIGCDIDTRRTDKPDSVVDMTLRVARYLSQLSQGIQPSDGNLYLTDAASVASRFAMRSGFSNPGQLVLLDRETFPARFHVLA